MEREMSQVSGQTAGRARRALALAALVAASALAQAQVPPAPCVALGGSFCSQPVGLESGNQDVPVTAQAAGTVAAVEVLRMGQSGLDFAPGIGLMTCVGTSTLPTAPTTASAR